MYNHTIISWNINSVRSKYPSLQLLLHDLNSMALCLQETELSPTTTFSLKNCNTYRSNNIADRNANGNILVAVSSSIFFKPTAINTNLQAVAVEIHIDIPLILC